MNGRLKIVVIGLSLSSSWGNGHATTFRSLLRGVATAGHDTLFLERNVPWYAANRDMPRPDFCDLAYYDDVDELVARYGSAIVGADAVIIGSYVPEGVRVIDEVARLQPQLLCFYDIDTPVTLANVARGQEEYLSAAQIPAFDIYFSFSGGEVLDSLEREFGARDAVALHCSVDVLRYRPTGEPTCWDLGYLGTYSADRQPTLERLLIEPARWMPDRRFVVAGPQYPEDIDWPENVERIDHLPPAEHPSFYSRQRFTLNVTRADMIAAGWSPSVRLFEAAACRTPIISDRWRGLDELLSEDKAVLIADTADDVTSALAMDEDTRSRIADTAYEIVRNDHSGTARAEQMTSSLRNHLRHRRLSEGPVKNHQQRIEAVNVNSSSTEAPTVLVAGGAGFVGSHLCDKLLSLGHRLICLDSFLTGRHQNIAPLGNHPNFSLITHDICSAIAIDEPLHQIYNLACPASPPHYQADPMHTMMTSVEGTRHMLELAQRHQARFLQASTSEIYGDPLQHPQQEEYLGNVNCTGPRACYDEGKRAAESMCFDMLRSGRVDARVVRIFNTYGPRMRPDNGRIISNFIVQALENKPLTVYGSGEQTRSFCYVTDLVGGLVAMMSAEPNPGVAVNLGNPGEFTVKDLADFICSLVATTSKIEHEPLPPDDPQRRRPDITRAREILGWSPVVSLAEGLPPTIDWFSQELQDREWQTSPLASGLSEPQEAAE
jgi:nucleoside-diphosphate-sugar epimerase/spore maturation protein CgeB